MLGYRSSTCASIPCNKHVSNSTLPPYYTFICLPSVTHSRASIPSLRSLVPDTICTGLFWNVGWTSALKARALDLVDCSNGSLHQPKPGMPWTASGAFFDLRTTFSSSSLNMLQGSGFVCYGGEVWALGSEDVFDAPRIHLAPPLFVDRPALHLTSNLLVLIVDGPYCKRGTVIVYVIVCGCSPCVKLSWPVPLPCHVADTTPIRLTPWIGQHGK
jgi:hypothetical protein